jgi:hypothetical protein
VPRRARYAELSVWGGGSIRHVVGGRVQLRARSRLAEIYVSARTRNIQASRALRTPESKVLRNAARRRDGLRRSIDRARRRDSSSEGNRREVVSRDPEVDGRTFAPATAPGTSSDRRSPIAHPNRSAKCTRLASPRGRERAPRDARDPARVIRARGRRSGTNLRRSERRVTSPPWSRHADRERRPCEPAREPAEHASRGCRPAHAAGLSTPSCGVCQQRTAGRSGIFSGPGVPLVPFVGTGSRSAAGPAPLD